MDPSELPDDDKDSESDPFYSIMDPHDDAEWRLGRDILARLGFEPNPPEVVDDAQMRGRLWELIYALASRRVYLSRTDHLSDRELYVWLHENWLNEMEADLPPEAEWNTRTSPVSGCGTEEDRIAGLRYYMDEEERRLWAKDFPEDDIPPHEDPPYDRDRFLPDAPMPIGGTGGWDFLDDVEEDDESGIGLKGEDPLGDSDPLGLKEVDAAIQQEQRRKIEEVKGNEGAPVMGLNDAGEPIREEWEAPMKTLRHQGVALLPPDEHTDETIGAGLWELLHELACRGFYVLHTNHFTDRELYVALWRDSLREPAILPGRSRTGGWFHDFTGSGSDESEQIRLRFYATEEERQKEKARYPDLALPQREKPVANRDWRVPKGPFG